jgi:virulence-associated protein VapD
MFLKVRKKNYEDMKNILLLHNFALGQCSLWLASSMLAVLHNHQGPISLSCGLGSQ